MVEVLVDTTAAVVEVTGGGGGAGGSAATEVVVEGVLETGITFTSEAGGSVVEGVKDSGTLGAGRGCTAS